MLPFNSLPSTQKRPHPPPYPPDAATMPPQRARGLAAMLPPPSMIPQTARAYTQRAADISFLSDRVQQRGSPRRLDKKRLEKLGEPARWREFRASIDSRALTSVRAVSPTQRPQQLPVSPGTLQTRWAAASHATSTVAHMLFPTDAKSVEHSLCAARAASRAGAKTSGYADGTAGGAQPPWGLPSTVELLDIAAQTELSGRRQALDLAAGLAARAGPAPPSKAPRLGEASGGGARGLSADLASLLRGVLPHVGAQELTLHQRAVQDGLLGLTEADVCPKAHEVDEGMRLVARQAASHCVEQGLLVEYVRRHYCGAVTRSHELLRVLQVWLVLATRCSPAAAPQQQPSPSPHHLLYTTLSYLLYTYSPLATCSPLTLHTHSTPTQHLLYTHSTPAPHLLYTYSTLTLHSLHTQVLLEMFDQLRQSTDERLLQRFHESLSDALASIGPSPNSAHDTPTAASAASAASDAPTACVAGGGDERPPSSVCDASSSNGSRMRVPSAESGGEESRRIETGSASAGSASAGSAGEQVPVLDVRLAASEAKGMLA